MQQVFLRRCHAFESEQEDAEAEIPGGNEQGGAVRKMVAVIEAHYPKGERGRRPLPLETMPRIHFMQQWFGLSDPPVAVTSASVHDFAAMADCLHGDEQLICGDTAYVNKARKDAAEEKGVDWRVQRKPARKRRPNCADKSFDR